MDLTGWWLRVITLTLLIISSYANCIIWGRMDISGDTTLLFLFQTYIILILCKTYGFYWVIISVGVGVATLTFQWQTYRIPSYVEFSHVWICVFNLVSLQIFCSMEECYTGSSRECWNTQNNHIWAVTCDFQQCGILTSVDSDEPMQSPVKLRNSKWCSWVA